MVIKEIYPSSSTKMFLEKLKKPLLVLSAKLRNPEVEENFSSITGMENLAQHLYHLR
jgi:hypothetical protein